MSDTLSLSQLRETLETRGIGMSLSALSEFVKTGDIAELLRVGGKGNRLEFLPETVDILAEFFPRYKEAKGRLPQAPAMLRSFLKPDNSTALVLSPASVPQITETPKAEERRGRAEGLAREDAIFTAEEASSFLRVSERQLRRYVKPSFRIGKSARGDRWRKSDLLSFGEV